MSLLTYLTPATTFTHEIPKIKGSRFLGTLIPLNDITEHPSGGVRKQRTGSIFPNATHHCYAYKLGIQAHQDLFSNRFIEPKYFRFNDDGEPANTAGKPILAMLDKYQLQSCALIVTRYFGGTLLGVGGLIKAYSECAEQTIIHSHIIQQEVREEITLSFTYDQTSLISHLISKYDAKIISEEYGTVQKKTLSVNKAYINAISSFSS